MVIIVFVTASGCGNENTPGGRPSILDESSASEDPEVQRVVSLAPSLTETVYDLGAENQLKAVTDNDHYPLEAEKLPSVGDMYPNLELIAASQPDLVLADLSLLSQDALSRLKQLNLNLLCVETNDLDDLYNNLPILARALKVPRKGEILQQKLALELDEIRKTSASFSHPYTVFVEIWTGPLTTCSTGSLMDKFVTLAGACNIYANQNSHYPVVSNEDLIKRNPEFIILTQTPIEQAVKLPGWQKLDAVKKGRVYHIKNDLLQRPTMRSLEGIKEIQHIMKQLDAQK